MDALNVSAVLVTRGNVPMHHIYDSLPADWEIIVWSNGDPVVSRIGIEEVDGGRRYSLDAMHAVSDLSVYGRYAAIEYASHDVCYTQDDDVIVSDPQAIVDRWHEGVVWLCSGCNGHRSALCSDCEAAARERTEHVVCNMPQEFRHDGYTDSALVGFGAAFHRDAPKRAFQRWYQWMADTTVGGTCMPVWGVDSPTFANWLGAGLAMPWRDPWFQRTCDVAFTTLTDRILVDVSKVNREFAEDADRMYRQPDHVGERARMLDLARRARDAA